MNNANTYEYRLHEALSNVMDHTSNYDGIPCKDKEHAERIMDQWANATYRDTWEHRLYEALSNVMEGTSNDDGIPCEIKEHAERIMDQWANEQIRKN
jgi:hypothetical protein